MLCENEHFNFMHKGHNFQDWWLAFQKSLLPTVLQWRLLLDVAARNYCMHATNIPWNLNIVLQLSCEAVLKISIKNIENCRRKSKKGPILVGPFLLTVCHSTHATIIPRARIFGEQLQVTLRLYQLRLSLLFFMDDPLYEIISG